MKLFLFLIMSLSLSLPSFAGKNQALDQSIANQYYSMNRVSRLAEKAQIRGDIAINCTAGVVASAGSLIISLAPVVPFVIKGTGGLLSRDLKNKHGYGDSRSMVFADLIGGVLSAMLDGGEQYYNPGYTGTPHAESVSGAVAMIADVTLMGESSLCQQAYRHWAIVRAIDGLNKTPQRAIANSSRSAPKQLPQAQSRTSRASTSVGR